MRTRFSSGRGLGCLGLATEHNLLNITIDIKVCTDFKMLKVKVPIIFFGTQGFSAHRDGWPFHFHYFTLTVYPPFSKLLNLLSYKYQQIRISLRYLMFRLSIFPDTILETISKNWCFRGQLDNGLQRGVRHPADSALGAFNPGTNR
jgi:hypothetical protein